MFAVVAIAFTAKASENYTHLAHGNVQLFSNRSIIINNLFYPILDHCVHFHEAKNIYCDAFWDFSCSISHCTN